MIYLKNFFPDSKTNTEKFTYVYLAINVKVKTYHTRVLKYLAQNDMLNKIDSISIVLAGSLLTGFIFSKNNLCWPENQSFIHETLPSIKETLLSGD